MILKNLNLKLKNIKEKLQNFVDYLKIKVVLNLMNFKKNIIQYFTAVDYKPYETKHHRQ